MCGINGFNFRDEDLITKMNSLISYRGPDQTGVYCNERISLGHDRLSIIDLSERGRQPMWDSKKEVAIIFNGEIYNYKELKRDLEKKHAFFSESDTEVILYAYKEYGIDCLKKFNGIFALAIWDARMGELYLARDQMGIKPLYYYFDGKRLIFSSEIKAILIHDIPRQLELSAINFFFHILYIPEPITPFQGIKKLPPASWLKFSQGNIQIKKYWSVVDFSNLSSRKETADSIADIFSDSVERQMISDRPVGIFLSGGLDSSAIAGAAVKSRGSNIKTFSVGFDVEKGNEKFNDDFLLARKTAQYFHTEHQELVVGANDLLRNLENIVWHLEEPNSNPTAGIIYLLSREAKKKVAVVLGGDGGDELFGGYPRYYYSRLISLYQKLPPSLRVLSDKTLRLMKKFDTADKLLSLPGAERMLVFLSQKEYSMSQVLAPEYINPNQIKEHFQDRYFPRNEELADDFEKLFMNTDRQSWLADHSLSQTDKMTMAFGLEERVPILDYRLVELANRMPTSWKINMWNNKPPNFQGKSIWREAIGPYLPSHILHEQKRGWFTPMAKWLRKEMRGFAEEILFDDNYGGNFFKTETIKDVWQNHLTGKRYNLNLIWAVIMWKMWYEQFIKNKPDKIAIK